MAVLAIETMIEDIAIGEEEASVAADLEAVIKEIVESEIGKEIAGGIVGGVEDPAGVLPVIVEVTVGA